MFARETNGTYETHGTYGSRLAANPKTGNCKTVNPYSGESFANILTQRLTVDATSGLLGRNLHNLTELRL